MKILLGVPEYPPYHVGGGGEVYKNLAENYKKLGHEVAVIYGYYPTKSWSEDIKEYLDENGIKFYQIPEIPYPKSMPFLRTVMPCNLKAYFKLKKIIEKEKPDVAHLHGYGLFFMNILASKLYKQNIRYIFTIHGYPETQNKSIFFIRKIWDVYVRFIMNKTLRRAKKITCVSNFIKNDPRNILQSNSVVIYNGINFKDFENVKSDIDIRQKYNINTDTKIIFSLGRIAEMKGFQDVIKKIPEFLSKGVNVKYLIAGDDDGYKKNLEDLIEKLNLKEYVEFVGFLDLETKKQYISQCDIFAIPSLWEPFGLVALEGMVFNKIVLTSNLDGLAEVLKDYLNKILLYEDRVFEKVLLQKIIPANRNIYNKYDYNLIVRSYLKILC